jgi:hypothetical protein
MSVDPVADFINLLGQCRLLEAEQQRQLTRDFRPRFSDPHALARELIQLDWLTPYQVNQLSQGRGGD